MEQGLWYVVLWGLAEVEEVDVTSIGCLTADLTVAYGREVPVQAGSVMDVLRTTGDVHGDGGCLEVVWMVATECQPSSGVLKAPQMQVARCSTPGGGAGPP